MSNKKFKARYQLACDTYNNWHSSNPILLNKEPVIVVVEPSEEGTQQNASILIKVGNGTDHFDDLPWVSALSADVYSWAKEKNKPTYAASEITGLNEYISGQINDTDTQYQIVKVSNTQFKLQSKPLTGEWQDVGDPISITYDIKEGSDNGTITVNGVPVSVHGLGDAAYTNRSEYDEAGAAEAVMVSVVGSDDDLPSSDTIKGTKKYVDEQILTRVSSVYKPGGSASFSQTASLLLKENEGKVYNITDEFTTDESFVDGRGNTYPAGTNIVCIDSGDGVYKWDVMAGFVDLSSYDTSEEVTEKISVAKQEISDEVGQSAKEYADGLNSAMDDRVNAVEGALANKIDASAVSQIGKTGKLTDAILEDGDYIILDGGDAAYLAGLS